MNDATYKAKDLVLGFQILNFRGQNETQKLFLSPANPTVHIEAVQKDTGRRSSLDLVLGEDMSLVLKQNGRLGVPTRINGEDIKDHLTREVEHGSIIQIGGELLKIRKVETHLGAKGPSTQKVYSSERRLHNRHSTFRKWALKQGLLLAAIMLTAIVTAYSITL